LKGRELKEKELKEKEFKEREFKEGIERRRNEKLNLSIKKLK
jgi:hypothetical protein